MPIVLIAELGLQLLCVLHAVRSGRDRTWIYIILFVPLAGSLAYIVAELLPELLGTRGARKAVAATRRILDPHQAYREALKQFEISPTAHNRRALAQACVESRAYGEAIQHYRSLLAGRDANDPEIMRALAEVQFLSGAHAAALATLDELKRHNPDYRSGEAHLIYARSLEALGRDAEAIEEYRTLCGYFGGEEARARLALLLNRLGREGEAAALCAEILRAERLAPKHYVRANREWIEIARRGALAT